ncbi:MAG: apolipoprotein N-acyltransferase, partial [Planctomycetia bacterium]|nr:apolipoprotein N-acyltransferase [Planctomycetia bacterium]
MQRYRTWICAFAGVLLYFLALPPVGAGILGWCAFAPWIPLLRTPSLTGRHPYRAIWCAGCVFWLATLHWLRYPHPATTLGWIALAIYLACYFPALVAIGRMFVHRYRWPAFPALAVTWTGLELLRAHLITGFLMVSIAHSQLSILPAWGTSLPIAWPGFLQIAELGGEYAATFLLVLTGGMIGEYLVSSTSSADRKRRTFATCGVLLFLGVTWTYGQTAIRAQRDLLAEHGTSLRVAAIQGSTPSQLKHSADPEAPRRILGEYLTLTREVMERPVDQRPWFIVWPETMFPFPLVLAGNPDSWTETEFRTSEYAAQFDSFEAFREMAICRARESREMPGDMVRQVGVPMLIGMSVWTYDSPMDVRGYNGAALFSADGTMTPEVYRKMHRVLFGEYIPLADTFPVLQRLTPLPSSLDAGPRAELLVCPVTDPQSGITGTVRVQPNICYESVLPHVIRRQFTDVVHRDPQRYRPQLLANLTNDGWFRGSCELDQHLCCAQMRAIETRTPWIIAANTGFSATIDTTGSLRTRGPRGTGGYVVDTLTLPPEAEKDAPMTFYLRYGDWLPGLCLVLMGIGLVREL